MRQIQCPRCGYVYTAQEHNANACPNCGLQTPAPDSATPTVTVTPAGFASAWGPPTATAPTISPYSSDAPTPTPAWAPDAHTLPSQSSAPPAQPFTPAPAVGNPANGAPYTPNSPRGGSRRLLAIVAAVVAAVVLLGVVGALAAGGGLNKASAKPTATTRVTPRPTAPALPKGYTLYTDKSGLYALGYPSDWSTTPVNDPRYSIIEFAQPNLGATVEIERVSFVGAALTAATAQPFLTKVFDGFTRALAGGNAGGHTSSVTEVKLAGNTWFEASGDINYTVNDSWMTTHLVVDMTAHGGSAVLVARIASLGSDYDSLNTQYFTPMLATFRFLK